MAKLYFKYGCMGSSKTAQLLMTQFNYMEKGMRVAIIKPDTDTRYGRDVIKSRISLSAKADYVLSGDGLPDMGTEWDVILCDEAQFLTAHQVDLLHELSLDHDIPVICYGLLTDFTTKMFEGSKRLMEVAESIMEIKTVCSCGRKAAVNARFVDGRVTTQGAQIQIGGNESYKSMCYKCWRAMVREAEGAT